MKKNVKFISFIVSMFLLLVLPVVSLCTVNFAPKEKDGRYFVYSTATATYVSGDFETKVDNAVEAKNSIEEVKEKFNLSAIDNELYYSKTIDLVYGKTYQFKQLYKGFFVYGKTLSVTVDKNGTILSITGNVDGDIDLQIHSDLLEPNLGNSLIDFEPYTISSTEMVVYEKENEFFFCYNLIVNSVSRYSCFIDAYTGNLVDALPLEENISTLPTSGYEVSKEQVTQKDAFENNVSVTMEKYVATSGSDTFYLLADSSKNIYMANNYNKTTYSGYDFYTSTSGAISDSVAVTAYVNLIHSYDFYKEYLDLEGISNGTGGTVTLIALVHYGTDYNNAAYAYTSASEEHFFIFGDGDASDGYTAFAKGLDVVGHEYTHAMTRSVVDFTYLNESGALSEAYSDMFGAMIEADNLGYDFTESKFWAVGEDLFTEDGFCIRNLKDPKIKSYSEKVADCNLTHNHENYGCDRGGVHSNCQIFTYAMYKMYEQGVFTDITSMATLLYSSLAYLTPSATLSDSRAALLTAASHLNLGEDVQISIMKAFADVGIGNTVNTYSFYADDTCSGEPLTVSAEIGSVITVPNCSFEKTGKFFWYWTNSSGDILEAGKTITMGSDPVSFYAVWSDTKLSVLSGDGNALSPYMIEDFNDLKSLAYYVNNSAFNGIYNDARYEIAADIDMQGELWTPIGTKENPFNGTFDGGKFNIKNINLSAGNVVEYNGLFGYVGNGGYIFDVVMSDGTINTEAKYTGAVVGYLKGMLVTCVNNIPVLSTNTAGGLVGLAETNEGASVQNCYNTAQVVAGVAGGLVGHAFSSLYEDDDISLYLAGYIVNSYNIGQVSGDIAGGIAGKSNGFYFINCINNGLVEASGGIAGGIVGSITLTDEINAPLVLPTKMVYSGVFGSKNSVSVNGNVYGAIVGKISCINTKGVIYLEKNTTLDGLDIIGNYSAFGDNETSVVKMISNKTSSSIAFEGDFDYDNLEYYLSDNWVIMHGYEPYDFVLTWKIEDGSMPTFTDVEFWLNYAEYFNGYGYEIFGYGSESKPYEINTAEQLAGLSALVANGQDFAGKYFKLTADIDLAGKAWIGIGMMYNAATDVNHGFSGTFDGNGYVIKNMQGTTVGSVLEDEDYTSGYRTLIYFASLFGVTAPVVKMNSSYTYTTYIPTIKNVVLLNSKVSGNYAGGIVGLGFSSVNIENCYNIDGSVASSNFAGGIVAYLGNNDVDVAYTNVTNQTATIKNCYSNAIASGVIVGGILGYAENVNTSLTLTVDLINCVNEGVVKGVGMDVVIEGSYFASSVGGIMGSSAAYKTNFINCIFSGTATTYINNGAVGGILGTLGMESFGQKVLTMKFVGCKVLGELNNLSTSNASNIGALIGSSAGKDILTVSIETITKSHYLTKYNAFGKNVNGGNLTSNTYNGANNSAYNFNESGYFTSELLDTTNTFATDIVNLLKAGEWITVSFKVNGEIVKEVTIRPGYHVDGFIPTKESTEYYQYNFLKWDGDLNFITGDTVLTALFERVDRKYVVTYKDGDLVYVVKEHKAGETLKTPLIEKESDFFYDYRFVEWDYSGTVLSDLEVHAVYEKTMKPQGAILLIGLLILCFALPIALVVRNHFKKKNYR